MLLYTIINSCYNIILYANISRVVHDWGTEYAWEVITFMCLIVQSCPTLAATPIAHNPVAWRAPLSIGF